MAQIPNGRLEKDPKINQCRHCAIYFLITVPSCKLTVRHGKSTILMVFTRKDRDFHGRTVSFREGKLLFRIVASIEILFWDVYFRHSVGTPSRPAQITFFNIHLAKWNNISHIMGT